MTLGRLPTELPLNVYCGDRFQHTLEFVDDLTLLPVDVSGFTYRAQIRSAQTDTAIMATFSFDLSMAAFGLVTMTLLPAVTTALLLPAENKSTKAATWDVELTEIADTTNVLTPFAGPVSIHLDRTR